MLYRILICLWLGAISCLGSAKDRDVVHIASGEWPPYFSQELPDYGVASRIVTEAFAQAGLEVEYQFYPWNRSLESTRAGAIESTIGWEKTTDREKDFLFSEKPIIEERLVFFYSVENPVMPDEVWQQEREEKLLIGVTLGYNYGKRFSRAEKQGVFNIYRSPSDEANLSLLLNRRIDLFPMDVVVGRHMLNKHFSPEERKRIKYHPEMLRRDFLYLLFSKKYPDSANLKKKFDQGMQQLRSSGRLKELYTGILPWNTSD